MYVTLNLALLFIYHIVDMFHKRTQLTRERKLKF